MAEASNEAPARVRLPEILAIAGLAMTVGGGLWSGGSSTSAIQAQTADNTRRIEQLETNDQRRADQLDAIRTVATRTETKVDMLLSKKDALP